MTAFVRRVIANLMCSCINMFMTSRLGCRFTGNAEFT